MEIQEIQKLLHRANEYLLSRNLVPGLKNSTIALKSAEKIGFHKGIIEANLLLSKLITKKAEYDMENEKLEKALQHLDEAETINNRSLQLPNFLISILILKGYILRLLHQLDKAENLYKEALAISENILCTKSKVNVLNGLSQLYMTKAQFDQAHTYGEQAFDLAQQINDKQLIIDSYRRIGSVKIRRLAYDRVEFYFSKIIELSQEVGDVENEAVALNAMAVAFGARSNFKEALSCAIEAQEKLEKINDKPSLIHNSIIVAIIFSNLYNHEEAISRYTITLDKYRNELTPSTHITILYNMGDSFNLSEKYQHALKAFFKCLHLAQKQKHQEAIAITLAQIASTYTYLERFDLAITYANKAQMLFNKLHLEAVDSVYTQGHQINLINLGRIHLQLNELDKALQYLEEGIKIGTKLNERKILAGYKLLAELFVKKDDYVKAFKYSELYGQENEKLAKIRNDRQLIDLEFTYSLEEKKKEIETLKKEQEYNAHLKQRNTELELANDELRQFTYAVSHDLREPLRMIASYADRINHYYSGMEKDPEVEESFNFMNDGVTRMRRLLSDLLKYATVGKTLGALEEIDLNKLVAEILQMSLNIKIKESKGKITTESLPNIVNYRSLIYLVFQNLLNNAIKFTPKDRPPIVHVSCTDNNEFYTIAIKDNGIGIAKQSQESVFTIFRRLHTAEEFSGTGLGLAMCKKIIKGLNGDIWLESEEGKGSTFYFTLKKSLEASNNNNADTPSQSEISEHNDKYY